MTETWAFILAWFALSILINVWWYRRDMLRISGEDDRRAIEAMAKSPEMMAFAKRMTEAIRFPAGMSDKIIFPISKNPTPKGRLGDASDPHLLTWTPRMEWAMSTAPAMPRSEGIIDPGGVGTAIAKAVREDRKRRKIEPDIFDDENWIMQ